MESIKIPAPAKINLAFDILRKRDDGYHDVRTIMQTVKLYDYIYIKKVDKYPVKLVCNLLWLPVDDKNLVRRAALYMFETFNLPVGMFIELTKNIPVAAGLGGGSADCAALITGVNKLYGLNLSLGEMRDIGAKFGADVPFCISGGTCLAEGIGDVLTEIPPCPHVSIVIVKLNFGLATANVFAKYDQSLVTNRPDIDKMIDDIKNGDVQSIADGFCNVLETVSVNERPEIGEIKQALNESGALNSLMSGSGPTVFSFFPSYKAAETATEIIKNRRFDYVQDLYVTEPCRAQNPEKATPLQ